MTKENALTWAKQDVENWHGEGYVVIHYDTPSAWSMFVHGKDYTPEVDYDYMVFGSLYQLEQYLQGQYGCDMCDEFHIRKEGESIVEVYSKSKLIIL